MSDRGTPPPSAALASQPPSSSPLHRAMPHESGLRHATGEALYVDELPTPRGLLACDFVVSPHAHARITRLEVGLARRVPGVAAVLTAADVPGSNRYGPTVADDVLLAEGEVHHCGQLVALVVGESLEICRAAAAAVVVDYEPLPAYTTLDEGLAAGSFLTEPMLLRRGDVDAALAEAELTLSGVFRTGAQDHFYLETHAALAVPGEDGTVRVASSTQHPAEAQAVVAAALGVPRHQVVVEVPRLGGGFGGKETQGAPFAALAALAAVRTGRAVKVRLDRDRDMENTGKRHPFLSRYRVGFTRQGELSALDVELFSDGGCTLDLSQAILDRALLHVDNAYFVPHVRLRGRVVRTHLPSNTAFRGFGGPQGMAVMEDVLSRIAEHLALDPAEVRRLNLYGEAPRNVTPYGQEVHDSRLHRLWDELLASSDYARRRGEVERFNQGQRWTKRGLAITPVKFGISFTTGFLNQAGALVLVYGDGSVQVNHGGTEMGQGLHTKLQAVCAHELGLPLSRVRVMTTATDKVPNTSATAASSGADLNGQAVRQACEVLRDRLRPVAAKVLSVPSDEVVFGGGLAFSALDARRAVPFGEVARRAVLEQVPLSATGFYRTPGLHFDRASGQGKPFHYFACGAAVSEVEVSGLTGEHRLRRVDILHDAGRSLAPSIDRGQVEGAFVQGVGWLTCEEVVVDPAGRLLTHSPSTYKIPTAGDVPLDFRVSLLERAEQPGVLHGSKAVGEPPLMLALSVVAALRHALAGFALPGRAVSLRLPATPEAVLLAVEAVRRPSAPT